MGEYNQQSAHTIRVRQTEGRVSDGFMIFFCCSVVVRQTEGRVSDGLMIFFCFSVVVCLYVCIIGLGTRRPSVLCGNGFVLLPAVETLT